MYRVLRPGGRLLLLGHIASRYPPVRLAQFAVQRYSQRITGDRQLRRTLPLVEAAGFRVDQRTLRRAGIIELLVASNPAWWASVPLAAWFPRPVCGEHRRVGSWTGSVS